MTATGNPTAVRAGESDPASSYASRGVRPDQIFPTLTPAQLTRIVAHGRSRPLVAGETLVAAGDRVDRFYVVSAGRIDVVRPTDDGEELVTSHRPGQFTGDIGVLSGRRGLAGLRAAEDGAVVELDREHLLTLVQTDAELSEILMRAFILRRVELIARGVSDVLVIGSEHCAGTLRVREFLTRNGHPHTYIDLDEDAGVQELLDRFHVAEDDVPVVICRGEVVLRNPSTRQIADCLDFNTAIDPDRVRDLVIIGAGPSGLAAAVYGSSEGLDVLVIEAESPGGQAGSSSMIENYLGFPTGISGQDLAGRAFTQAQKFGTDVLIAKKAVRLLCERRPYGIELDGGSPIHARAIIIATGVDYRSIDIDGIGRLEGAGVYHGATFLEAKSCRGQDIVVVGGGNSAGQAAVFLARTARHVDVLVRGSGLAATMSRYLVRRIETTPNITLRPFTEVHEVEGEYHVERIHWHDNRTGEAEVRDIRHLFVMTGAIPSTAWLDGCVLLDANGFIRTGREVSDTELEDGGWPLQRPPHLLETSLPGVFAVGDVRCGSLKRVASAVGEGSIAIAFVHETINE